MDAASLRVCLAGLPLAMAGPGRHTHGGQICATMFSLLCSGVLVSTELSAKEIGGSMWVAFAVS